MTQKEQKSIEKFLDFILDKVEDCYYRECKSAVKEFIKEINNNSIFLS